MPDQAAVDVQRAFGCTGVGVEFQHRLAVRGHLGQVQPQGQAVEATAGQAQERCGQVARTAPGARAVGQGFFVAHFSDQHGGSPQEAWARLGSLAS